MGKIGGYGTPKLVQREALKYIARNGPQLSKTIHQNIYSIPSTWSTVGQNMSVLQRLKLVRKVTGTNQWDVTTSGMAQADAWAIADGETPIVSTYSFTNKEYRWDIIAVQIRDLAKTPVSTDYEPFAGSMLGSSTNSSYSTIFFRRLVEA